MHFYIKQTKVDGKKTYFICFYLCGSESRYCKVVCLSGRKYQKIQLTSYVVWTKIIQSCQNCNLFIFSLFFCSDKKNTCVCNNL